MMKKILVILIFISSFNLYGQDPSFSQIDNNSMFMNPAMCGSSGYPKLLIARREQWKELKAEAVRFH